ITLSEKREALLIAPLGAAAVKRLAIGEGETPPSLMRAAMATEPALWQAGEKLTLPRLAVRPIVAPFARFLPSFDLAPASAVAELIGAPPLPASPFSGHSAG
ncbi:MAG: tRNA(Ile)-lysidine synthetase, partial [Mesorhizobium sp.]